MTQETVQCFDKARALMSQAVEHLDKEFHKIRAGKAHPQMLDSVKVESYGSLMPINQVASINTPDARSILVQPWDKNLIGPIEKAIMAANLGFNPQNDGITIRINVPELTGERRKDMVKLAKNEMENAKISIRNARRIAIEEGKKLEKEGIPEDACKKLSADVQKLHDDYIKQVDELFNAKEKEIMTV
ncbi:MAG: ribosome recycling factor [Bacteroidales bacterium]